jgi:hypothetical protein
LPFRPQRATIEEGVHHVIKLRGGAVGVSARRLGGTLALAAVCAVALAVMLAPTTASASYAKCHGSLAPDNGANIDDPNCIDYTLYCNHVFHAYTLFSTSPVEFFGTSSLVYAGTDPKSAPIDGNGSFSCEGITPSRGFGCNGGSIPGTSPARQGGTTTKNEAVVGQFVTEDKLCATHHQPRPKVWFSIVETQYDTTGHAYQTSSGPFRLPNGCQQRAGHHKHHHKHHHR